MAADDGFQPLSLKIGPGQAPRIQQSFLYISSQRVAVPNAEMEDLVSPEEKAFEMKSREPMVNACDPLRHAHVVGVFRFELEFDEGARSIAYQAVSFASNAAVRWNAGQRRVAVGN